MHMYAHTQKGDLTVEGAALTQMRTNLAAAGLLDRAVVLPAVVDHRDLGVLCSRDTLVMTILRGVSAADPRTLQHSAGSGACVLSSTFVQYIYICVCVCIYILITCKP